MSKNNKNTGIKFLILVILSAIISYGASFSLITLIKNKLKFVFNKELLFAKPVLITTAVIFAICLIIFLSVYIKYKFIGYTEMIESNTELNSKLYGSSHWQSKKEMDKNYPKYQWKLAPVTEGAHGFVVASHKRKDGTLEVNRIEKTHALALATTQVGKTKYFLSPNIQYLGSCLEKPSLFITDPKGELFADNSAYLKARGYNVFVFNLDEPTRSNKYNPLGIVWDFYHKYHETQDTSYLDDAEALLREVASTIAPIVSTDATWDIGAQNIIQGICLALLEDSLEPAYNITKKHFTLWQVLNILTQSTENLKDFALRRPRTSLARQRLAQYVDNSAKETLGSFMVTTTNKLNQYVDTGMTMLMSDTELEIDDIASKPYAIFCIVPDSNTARHPLAVLFASQIYKYLIYLAKQENKQGRGQKLPKEFYFLLEEFGNFPKMDCIEQMLSIGGGRRIWTCIILQSLSQLKKIYGKETAETILNNLKLQIYLGVTENDTNEYYSKFFGSQTIKKNSVQLASADLSKDLAGSTGAEKKMLIHPDELMRLDRGEILFKMFGHHPCRTRLVPIFDDKMQANGTFRVGAIKIDWENQALNPEDFYFDLLDRDEIYDKLRGMKEVAPPSKKEEHKEEKIEVALFVEQQTADAVLVTINEEKVWLPKSQVEIDGEFVLFVNKEFADTKNIFNIKENLVKKETSLQGNLETEPTINEVDVLNFLKKKGGKI